jgi:hypothetical protein
LLLATGLGLPVLLMIGAAKGGVGSEGLGIGLGVKHLAFALCLFYGLAVEIVLVGVKR